MKDLTMYETAPFGAAASGVLEHKFVACESQAQMADDGRIEGYASIFGAPDRGGDVVVRGAFQRALSSLKSADRRVKLLWQHDPAQPIGVWDEVKEDARGLYVSGRILPEVQKGAEAIALLKSGAIDGLSIGYRVVRAAKGSQAGRILQDVELWEVSLVTFPMLPQARATGPVEPEDQVASVLADAFAEARGRLRG